MIRLTAQDKKWRAQDDARALIQAEGTNTDRSRKSAALKEVKLIAIERNKEAKAAARAAKSPKRKTSNKPRTRKTTRKK